MEYVQETWDQALTDLAAGKLDLLLPVQMTEERKALLAYSDYLGGYEAIGLATCRELVRLMDGDITCASEPGKGSVFTVDIRVERVCRPQRQRKQREPIPCDLMGVNILLCEDNAMNQAMEKRLLERMGCTVDIAADGRIGCDCFAKSEPGHYAVILMDIRMPEMDGLEATRTIRAMDRPDAKTVTIMAVSANAFEEDVQKSLAAGMNEHLAKPMDVRVIHEKIKEYCF